MTTASAPRYERFLLPALLLLVVIPWVSSFEGGYVFDDSREITRSTRIQSFTPLRYHLRTQRPLQSLSLALNYKISGFDIWSYHLFNLLIHLGSTAALFFLVRGTLAVVKDRVGFSVAPAWIAFAVALLWGAHPLQTESVTYIVQRAESLMGLFYLLGMLAVLKGLAGDRPVRFFSLAAFWGALGMVTKIVIGSLPFVAVVYDRLFFGKSFKEVLKKRWLPHLILFSIWLVPTATGLMKKLIVGQAAGSGGGASAGLSLTHISKVDYLFSQPGVILHYIRLVFAPVGLCLDYTWPAVDSLAQGILPGLVIIALLGFGFYALSRGRTVALPILAFFFILTPTSSVFPLFDLAAEHRMYLSSACVILLAVLAALAAAKRWNISSKALLGGLMVAYVALSVGTWSRNLDYADEESMWHDVLEKVPSNGRALYQLAAIAYDRGDYVDARQKCEESTELFPNYGLNVLLMAQLENRDRRYASSLRFAEKAVKMLPNLPTAWNVYGGALFQVGRYQEAVAAHRRASFLAPRDPKGFTRRAQAFIKLGDMKEAARALDRAFKEGSDSAEAYSVKGVILRWRGDLKGASLALEESLKRNDQDAQTWVNYSLALESNWQFEEARKAAVEAAEVDSLLGRPHLQVGLMSERQADYDSALASYRKARDMDEGPLGTTKKTAQFLVGRVQRKMASLADYRALKGGKPTGRKGEVVALYAFMAMDHGQYGQALELFDEAFRLDPKLAVDLNAANRYSAALCAGRVGKFEKAAPWLLADLKLRTQQAKGSTKARRLVGGAMRTWLMEPTFAPVRVASAPSPWPEIWRRARELSAPVSTH